MSGTDSDGVAGQWDPTAGSSEFNAQYFLALMLMSKNSTATLVKVTAINIPTEPGATGTVDVQPLVNLIDGAGNATKHGVLHGLPYMRLQGGKNAFLMDPVVNDIGLVVFADRDISAVVSTKAQANPGSRRRFGMADGMYVGGFLCGVPEQYVQFTDTGMKLADKNGNTIVSSNTGWAVTGNMKVTGTLEATGAVTADSSVLIKGTLDTQGAATFESTIDVKGQSTFEALGTFQNALNITGTLAVTGAVNATGIVSGTSGLSSGANLSVTGNATIGTSLAANTISATAQITAGGNISAADLAVSGHTIYSLHQHADPQGGVTGTPN